MVTETKEKQFDWMNPLNRIKLTNAVKARAKTVKLDTSHKKDDLFRLFYYRPGKVWVQHSKRYTPCGWFDIGRIEKGQFVEHGR